MNIREIESERLVKQNVGPGGLYDLYIVKYKGFKNPEKVFRLNQRGKALVERFRRRIRNNQTR